ncbi:MAG: FAD-binding oxidoreductase [Chloroflexota bacterium]|nr:FAD-binding oxidoreductase [Chloroflexota bacterium]
MSAAINTGSGLAGVIDEATINDLRAALGAQLITPNDEIYDQARQVWNGMIDRRPALIARCRGVADVIACVQWAVDHDILLAVRGGGHNVAGFGTCDGGLVIDLSPMKEIRVDLQRRTARVGGGSTWADVDRETQIFGLAAPGGIVSTTGIAGLTLGGGQGWLRRTFGMTCDSLVSADVVTADGRLLVASETENSDLFWALRGGGGNFGVVTSFEYRLHPVGPMVAFAGPVYPLERTTHVMETFRGFLSDAPDEINVSATWWTIPPVPGFPAELHGQDVLILGGVYAGSAAEGERLLKPLREIDEPVSDLSATLPYVVVQQIFDPFFPQHELRYYWKSIYLAGLGREVIEEIKGWMTRRPSPMSMASVWALGGALSRVSSGETAAGDRQAPFVLEILANWKESSETDDNVSWARDFFVAMERFSSGKTNLNFPGLGEDPHFVRAAFGGNFDRLVSLKKKYDPTNVFHLNQNIDPQDPAGLSAAN